MKIVKIIGGLGNQMFQYAFYLSLKKKYAHETVKIDNSLFDTYSLHNGFELKRIFDISAEYATPSEINRLSRFVRMYKLQRAVRKFLPAKKTEFVEKYDFKYAPEVWTDQDKYYEGYWQNVNYFTDVEEEVRSAFSFKAELSDRNQTLLKEIQDTPESVSMHVRRGDYVNHKIFGGICDLDYYKSAIDYVLQNNRSPRFYLFSNDIEWCKTNLLPLIKGYPAIFVDWNSGNDSYVDMQLMSCCRTNIIANSSFSWWAAWLNSSSDKQVIAPRLWAHTPYGQEIQLKNWYLI